MSRNLRVEVVITIIILVVITASSVAVNNFFKYKKQVERNDIEQLQRAEDNVKNSLTTLDKAYYLFDQQTTEQMIENSSIIKQMYEQSMDYKELDLDTLSEQFGMDIYLIDENNVIVHSNENKDIGLDFSVCCPKLMPLFNERREKGDFLSPGIDVEQTSGSVKKFSYEGTDDGKFIIELGYSLENDKVFDVFSFLEEIKTVEEKYSAIQNIRVLNIGGLAIGGDPQKLNQRQREAFEETLKTYETVEIIDEWDGEEAKYRYVYYDTNETEGRISEKIIEIVYNHNESEEMISKNFKTLIIQITIIIISTILITTLIYYWISKHIYMAQHDSLTGLKNRAAFGHALSDLINNKIKDNALMMIDLDNFKNVNDTLGHGKGDHVLKLVSNTLKNIVGKDNRSHSVYRVGGDEFTVMLTNTTLDEAVHLAEKIIKALHKTLTEHKQYEDLKVSASIGITMQEDIVDEKVLYKQADRALYKAKEKGKNCYHVYDESLK